MPVLTHLSRPLAAVAVGAALLVPLAPISASASPTRPTHPVARTAAATVDERPARSTQVTLTAYGDTDSRGAVHLSGSVRWSDGARLGHRQAVSLWSRSGTRWTLLTRATTDTNGDVELAVTPSRHTTYQLRFAGARSTTRSRAARASTSDAVAVHVVAHLTLTTPTTVRHGKKFTVTGLVTPAGAGRIVTLAGDGQTYTALTTRADGSFTAHVRLRSTTTLSALLPDTASLDGAVSGPHTVRTT